MHPVTYFYISFSPYVVIRWEHKMKFLFTSRFCHFLVSDMGEGVEAKDGTSEFISAKNILVYDRASMIHAKCMIVNFCCWRRYGWMSSALKRCTRGGGSTAHLLLGVWMTVSTYRGVVLQLALSDASRHAEKFLSHTSADDSWFFMKSAIFKFFSLV